ncbi:MAG: hypothetical protein IKO55_11055, partial [Kiritimatiellae bacterium]|nr:hypothetical protein [Kiritimatiellia bacterium]
MLMAFASTPECEEYDEKHGRSEPCRDGLCGASEQMRCARGEHLPEGLEYRLEHMAHVGHERGLPEKENEPCSPAEAQDVRDE